MATTPKQPVNARDVLERDLSRVTIALGPALKGEEPASKYHRERTLESLGRIADALQRLRAQTIEECIDALRPEYPDVVKTLQMRMAQKG